MDHLTIDLSFSLKEYCVSFAADTSLTVQHSVVLKWEFSTHLNRSLKLTKPVRQLFVKFYQIRSSSLDHADSRRSSVKLLPE